MRTKKLIICSLFTALTFIATWIIKVPIPATGGFINVGDSMVIICGIFLGPIYGGFAAAVGSALVDMVSGYMAWTIATFIIKGLMAIFSSLLFKALYKKIKIYSVIICGIAAEIVMTLGYFIYESFLFNLLTAAAGIPLSLIQSIFGLILSIFLFGVLSKNKYIRENIKLF